MTIEKILPALAVTDLETAVAWYERFLGRSVDARPMDTLAEWQVTTSDRLQVVRDAERAGSGLLTLAVDHLDAHLAGLAERDVDAGPIEPGSGLVRFATVRDLESNTITLVEDRQAGT